MLERYFVKPDTIDRIRASWIGELVEQYVRWLTENHYSARTILRRVPILMSFGKYAWGRGAKTWEGLPDYVDPFAEMYFRQRGYNRRANTPTSKLLMKSKTRSKGCLISSYPALAGTEEHTKLILFRVFQISFTI